MPDAPIPSFSRQFVWISVYKVNSRYDLDADEVLNFPRFKLHKSWPPKSNRVRNPATAASKSNARPPCHAGFLHVPKLNRYSRLDSDRPHRERCSVCDPSAKVRHGKGPLLVAHPAGTQADAEVTLVPPTLASPESTDVSWQRGTALRDGLKGNKASESDCKSGCESDSSSAGGGIDVDLANYDFVSPLSRIASLSCDDTEGKGMPSFDHADGQDSSADECSPDAFSHFFAGAAVPADED